MVNWFFDRSFAVQTGLVTLGTLLSIAIFVALIVTMPFFLLGAVFVAFLWTVSAAMVSSWRYDRSVRYSSGPRWTEGGRVSFWDENGVDITDSVFEGCHAKDTEDYDDPFA